MPVAKGLTRNVGWRRWRKFGRVDKEIASSSAPWGAKGERPVPSPSFDPSCGGHSGGLRQRTLGR